MAYTQQVFVEAFWIGILIMIIGLILNAILQNIAAIPMTWRLAPTAETFQTGLALLLFLTGFITHLIAQSDWAGLNKKYCKEGEACKEVRGERV